MFELLFICFVWSLIFFIFAFAFAWCERALVSHVISAYSDQAKVGEKGNKIKEQECIPVGCLPAAHWPYAGLYFPGGGLLPGDVCSGDCVCGIPACTEADPPVNRMTDRCKNITLTTTSLRPVTSEKAQRMNGNIKENFRVRNGMAADYHIVTSTVRRQIRQRGAAGLLTERHRSFTK